MNRSELEHILRAPKGITGESHFVVVGSQSILGKHPDAPRALRQSMEADLYPRDKPELPDYIDGNLGRYSRFDDTFGYHADGVSPTTATLPEGWPERLIPVSNENTEGATGWCLDPYDLAYSKLAAARKKDIEFVANLLKYKLIKPTRLQRVIHSMADQALRGRLTSSLVVSRNWWNR